MKVVLIAVPLLLVLGCNSTPDQQLVGAWSTDQAHTDVPVLAFGDFGTRIKRGISSMRIKISADHTFVVSGIAQYGGKWTYHAGKLTLTPDKAAGWPVLPLLMNAHEFTVSGDFSRLSIQLPTKVGVISLVMNKTA